MGSENMTKSKLYKKVNSIRKILDIELTSYPIYLESYIGQTTQIQRIPLQTDGLRGMVLIKDVPTPIIVLDENLTSNEANFYCGHEIFHLLGHPSKNNATFTCYDSIRPQQNCFQEWEANEGAAELLVPYQDFIPRFLSYNSEYTPFTTWEVLENLADYYHVSVPVIKIRLDNLSYEIYQYLNGTSMENIKLLSRNQLKVRGIQPPCYSNILPYELDWDAAI